MSIRRMPLGWFHRLVLLIYNVVVALFTLQETGGTVTTDGTEQDVYINNAPAGIYEPRVAEIDLTNMTAAETIVVRLYKRIATGGALVLKDSITYVGVQAIPLKKVELVSNRYGIQVTLECTAGGPIDVP